MGDFPGGLVVRIWHFHCRGLGSIPGWGTIPHAAKIQKKKKVNGWRKAYHANTS